MARAKVTPSLDTLEHKLAEVVEASREMEQSVEEAEGREEGEYRLPEGLQEAKQLREAIQASLQKMVEVKREHLHPQEPEARMMPCEGRKELAYKAQAVVDERSEMVEGFRRWAVRGLENAETQWSMICAAFNLKKMYKAWTAGKLALA